MINNNDETIQFMNLECLVRVYFTNAPGPIALTESQRAKLRGQINKALTKLDNIRGYNFDTITSTEQWLKENK